WQLLLDGPLFLEGPLPEQAVAPWQDLARHLEPSCSDVLVAHR
ncbi:MAG: hypothetical protein ACI90M_001180, partial [Candidatus Azotimanducaceae bacterium]